MNRDLTSDILHTTAVPRLKLLHLCPTLDPESGGTVTAIRNLTDFSPENQSILCLDAPDSPWLKLGKTACVGLGHRGGKYSYCPQLVPYLQANARAYDLVVVHGNWQYHGLGAWRALKHKTTPYVIFPHGMLDPWFRKTYPLKHVKKIPYWYWWEKQVLEDSSGVLFTSKEEQKGAHASFSFSGAREEVVPLGIEDPVPFSRAPGDRSQPTLLFLGRLDFKKGCDLLLRGFARAMKETSWKLIMAGPDTSGWKLGLQELALELGIAAQVEWPGMLKGSEKWNALQHAQALILPSHQENFGLVVVEALACGTPVLISRQVNIWQEIVEDGAGLAAADDWEGVTSLLQQWRGLSPEEKVQMTSASRRCFQTRFEIRHSFAQLMKVLEGCLRFSAVHPRGIS